MTAEPWYAYAIMAVALAGTAMNVRRSRWCWPVWMASNAASAAYLASGGFWTQAGLQVVFLAVGVWGWITWTRAERSRREASAMATQLVSGYEAQLAAHRALEERMRKAHALLDAELQIARGWRRRAPRLSMN